MKMRRELISIIITSYREILNNTLYLNYEVIIVNYGWPVKLSVSDSLDPQLVNTKNHSVYIINMPRNIGYSGANLLGLKYAKGSLIALLNNDTEVTKGWLSALYRVIKVHKDVAAVQSKLMLMDLPNRIDSLGHILDPLGFLRAVGYLEEDGDRYDKMMEICIIQPAACLIKREVIDKIGLFHEEYF